jgi:hypothetical protein
MRLHSESIIPSTIIQSARPSNTFHRSVQKLRLKIIGRQLKYLVSTHQTHPSHRHQSFKPPIINQTYMPNINPQHKRILPTPLRGTQNPHGNNIVEPIVVPIASLEHNAKLQAACRLRGPGSLQQDVRAVVRAEVVAGVGAEDAGLGVGYSLGRDVSCCCYCFIDRSCKLRKPDFFLVCISPV